MRIFLCLCVAISLTSCAYQGTIVQKQSRPHPLYHSVGIEGVYSFTLRDSSGAVNQQMVTPDVFEAYAVGEYFNDLQAPPTHGDDKDVRTAPPVQHGVYLPPRITMQQRSSTPQKQVIVAKVATTPRPVASTSSAVKTSKPAIAHKSTGSAHKKAVAHHSKSGSAKKKIASTKKHSATKHVAAKRKAHHSVKVTSAKKAGAVL